MVFIKGEAMLTKDELLEQDDEPKELEIDSWFAGNIQTIEKPSKTNVLIEPKAKLLRNRKSIMIPSIYGSSNHKTISCRRQTTASDSSKKVLNQAIGSKHETKNSNSRSSLPILSIKYYNQPLYEEPIKNANKISVNSKHKSTYDDLKKMSGVFLPLITTK